MALVDKVMKEGLKVKFEGLEDSHKAPKVFMLHVISKEHQIEQVGEVKLHKKGKTELAGRG